jgi:Domain of unknown function (DUF1905)
MNLEFSGEMWFWKGPAPWHFVTVPDEECTELEETSTWAGPARPCWISTGVDDGRPESSTRRVPWVDGSGRVDVSRARVHADLLRERIDGSTDK